MIPSFSLRYVLRVYFIQQDCYVIRLKQYHGFFPYLFHQQKLNGFPTQRKYFFHVEQVSFSKNSKKTISSVETGEYLHGDEKGRAFMKAAPRSALYNNQPRDRYTWFVILFSKP